MNKNISTITINNPSKKLLDIVRRSRDEKEKEQRDYEYFKKLTPNTL